MTVAEINKLYKTGELENISWYETEKGSQMLCATYEGKYYITFWIKTAYLVATKYSSKAHVEESFNCFVKEFDTKDRANKYFKACKGYKKA